MDLQRNLRVAVSNLNHFHEKAHCARLCYPPVNLLRERSS